MILRGSLMSRAKQRLVVRPLLYTCKAFGLLAFPPFVLVLIDGPL